MDFRKATMTACRERCLGSIASLVAAALGSGIASAGYSPGSFIIPGASPSQMNLLSETFSVRASAPKPVSLGAFRQALSSMSDVSLL